MSLKSLDFFIGESGLETKIRVSVVIEMAIIFIPTYTNYILYLPNKWAHTEASNLNDAMDFN